MTDKNMAEYIGTLPSRVQHMYRLVWDMYLDCDHTEESGIVSDLYSVFYSHAKAHARKGRKSGDGADPK